MKTRHLEGRRISGVSQYRFKDEAGRLLVAIKSLTLEDGRRIVFSAEETETEPVVTAIVYDREGRRLS